MDNSRVAINRITGSIGCLDAANLQATLISTTGFHCHVWQCAWLMSKGEEHTAFDCVIKKHLHPCTLRETRILYKEYRTLKSRLEDMVPEAVFVPTLVDGQENVIVIAETVYPWFNIANPVNDSEAIPLLRRLPKARMQLRRFVEAAREWYETGEKVIDLWGLDNLVLDRDRQIRYIDSFRVFFYADVLHLLDEVEDTLRDKIEVSLQRREYLEHLLREASIVCVGFVAEDEPAAG
ncbi:MAG: hypothetical protein M3Z21_11725 [Pseudomonadota bacterium]|nr:hypothetical protein [Pseudomonadota bacterium]